MNRLDFIRIRLAAFFLVFLSVLLLASCSGEDRSLVDYLNEKSYDFHYRNLDSTRVYADSALSIATKERYIAGQAEALNNLAFVDIAVMHYKEAEISLKRIASITNNQLELLVADVQLMRLCQKESKNQDFYSFAEDAKRRIGRIKDEEFSLSDHEKKRLTYAETEYYIVASAYYYYVGLSKVSQKMLLSIDPYGSLERDTAQLLNYWYNIGAGGVLTGNNQHAIAQEEFDYLVGTYDIATKCGYPYWSAQALQAMSEHIQDNEQRSTIIADNYPSIVYINKDKMPDSLLAGNLAQRALNIFESYGDVYQTAGAYRTLAECYWHINDNRSALICLNRALGLSKSKLLNSKIISQAPDLVASIREDLCLVYSAANDKRNSDINRNIYLDLQEQTRQDRQLEARAAQLDESVKLLNIMITTVVIMIVIVIILLVFFAKMRRRSDDRFSINALLQPLSKWQQHTEKVTEKRKDHYEEIIENSEVVRLHIKQNRQRNLEQRAKISLVISIMPLIDRMRDEVKRLIRFPDKRTQERFNYVAELCDSINDSNNVLTQWIQMRQGELSLRIESFPLQSIFDIVSHSAMGFAMKGIKLVVKPTDAIVKADKTLTLFMVNTIADNARKFTPEGGEVVIQANSNTETDKPNYIEVSVSDNGPGMSEETQEHIFDRTYTGGHGFGLKNCKGIIEKYKKISSIFNICTIGCESPLSEKESAELHEGDTKKEKKGTKIFFRLPLGRARIIITLFVSIMSALFSVGVNAKPLMSASDKGRVFADSAYLSNVMGDYDATLRYADSCKKYVSSNDTAIILDISNETAIAALALHKWDVYKKSNSVYTRLFREQSADSSLPSYVRAMQRSKTNRTVAVVLLIMLLMVIFPAYYFLYYRHKLNYKFCVERINQMNVILLSDKSDEAKLKGIEELSNFSRFNLTAEQKEILHGVVERIILALKQNIKNSSNLDTEAELANDECKRLELDNDRLHISNSVLDNCLSTLKHETMYYPSRIRQMIIRKDVDLNSVLEVISYYHDLYSILAEQAMKQVLPQRIDKETVDNMFEILKKCNGGMPISKTVSTESPEVPSRYVKVRVVLSSLKITDEQIDSLFTPSTINLDFLLCRQTVREMGEVTNLRSCGVSASRGEDGSTVVNILMPKRFLK